MGSRGGTAPNGLRMREVRTLFLRAPRDDWPRLRIVSGSMEFRTRPRDGSACTVAYTPIPVVLYCAIGDQPPTRLMLLEARRKEPVLALSGNPEALALAGYETYDHFRREWRRRNQGRYDALEETWVWRVRPFTPEDAEEAGRRFLATLYDYGRDQ